jgi:hypothetical protein
MMQTNIHVFQFGYKHILFAAYVKIGQYEIRHCTLTVLEQKK